MNVWRLIRSGLAFYWRTHLAVLLGTAVGTAILVGALVAGDSVRYSLRGLAVDRLGRTEIAITADERFFRSRLADDIVRSGGLDAAPVLLVRCIAKNTEKELLANAVNVIGVDERFWSVGGAAKAYPHLEDDTAVINDHLAARLDVRDGDEVLLRIERPDLMPWEMPFSARGSGGPLGSSGSQGPGGSPTLAVRVRIEKTLTDESFGRFSLRANQAAPLNVFLSLPYLGKKLGLEERANAILLAGREGKDLRLASVGSLLRACWRLPDAGLELRSRENGRVTELVSDRVFLDPPVVYAPYSFVSASGAPLIPSGTPDDGIVINEWLAEDLGASTGDVIGLSYYVPAPGGALEEKHSDFRVLKVSPIEGPAADAALMPNFPGLAGVESCRDWRPGVPIDLTKIRRKDEQYWNTFRGTPKAFVTLDAARAMWKNRFGDLTAVRYAGSGEKPERTESETANEILRNLDPASVGIKVLPVRETSDSSSSG
jgi:putative ABC transport system permease protein